MKGAAAVIAAGSAFAGSAVGGLLLGVWLDHVRRTDYLAVIGLFAGIVAGGYAAFRLLLQSNAS
jgi:hypothetical protein